MRADVDRANASRPILRRVEHGGASGLCARAQNLHAELYPAYRMRGRLKYLAGSADRRGRVHGMPEENVKELQPVEVNVEA